MNIFELPAKIKYPPITDNPAAGITSEPAVPGDNISSIAISKLFVTVQSDKYYTWIDRKINATNMHYTNLLSKFNIEWYAYE